MYYKIHISATSKSLAEIGPFCREDYIVGQKYQIYYEVENVGKTSFPGGELTIEIHWPNGQIVRQINEIKPLTSGEAHRTKTYITDALARGFALFYALPILANDGKTVIPNAGIVHIHSIYAKPSEEITEYWAMWISAISLLLFVVINLIQFIVGLLNL